MKKSLSLISVLIMMLSVFTGCGGNTANGANTTGGSSDSTTKSYIIGTDTTFPPFEFTNDSNEFIGIDLDILAAVASDQGFEYELKPLGFDAAVAALESGQVDGVIAGMSITDERKEKFDFSEAYYDSTVCAAVAADSTAKTLDDIKGKSVAVKTGTQSSAWAESIKSEYSLKLTYFDDSSLMYQDVLSGNSIACFEDYPVMAYGVSQDNGLKLLVEESEKFATPYGFAVGKDKNAELLSKFNTGLKNIKENGTYDKIIAKYTSTESQNS